MIFGHDFWFDKESGVESLSCMLPSKEKTIEVVRSPHAETETDFSKHSGWISLSGQEVRYWSHKPFKDADTSFSWALEVRDVLTLLWCPEENKIYYIKAIGYAPKRLEFWIYHTFFPLVLELKRTYHILHVGSVEIDGKPILFSASSFGGKSTLTDFFIQKGHALLGDDTVAIDERSDGYYAIASYPYHRPYRTPEDLGYGVKNFATTPKPLHAIYLLEKCAPHAQIVIENIKGIEKFTALYDSVFVEFDFMKKERMAFFASLARAIPLYRITIPWDKQRLDEVYGAIVEHAHE